MTTMAKHFFLNGKVGNKDLAPGCDGALSSVVGQSLGFTVKFKLVSNDGVR